MTKWKFRLSLKKLSNPSCFLDGVPPAQVFDLVKTTNN